MESRKRTFAVGDADINEERWFFLLLTAAMSKQFLLACGMCV